MSLYKRAVTSLSLFVFVSLLRVLVVAASFVPQLSEQPKLVNLVSGGVCCVPR